MEIIEIRFEWFLLNQKWEETEKSTQIHRQTEFDWDKYGKNKNQMKIYDAPPIRGIEMKKKKTDEPNGINLWNICILRLTHQSILTTEYHNTFTFFFLILAFDAHHIWLYILVNCQR